MKYKVIKEIGALKKGDILENSAKNPQLFSMEERTDNSYKYVSISDDIADVYVEDGYLLELTDSKESDEDECLDRIATAVDQIDSMLKQYEEDNASVTEKFSNNEIPYCAKVEADTVHFNLTKALNKIKSILVDE